MTNNSFYGAYPCKFVIQHIACCALCYRWMLVTLMEQHHCVMRAIMAILRMWGHCCAVGQTSIPSCVFSLLRCTKQLPEVQHFLNMSRCWAQRYTKYFWAEFDLLVDICYNKELSYGSMPAVLVTGPNARHFFRFFPISIHNHHWYCVYQLRDDQAELAWMPWLNAKTLYLRMVILLSTNPARRLVSSLMSLTMLPLNETTTTLPWGC